MLPLVFLTAAALYLAAALVSGRRYGTWPLYRHWCLLFGVIGAAAATVGPLAERAHVDFTAHMTAHLLLGMLSPLLLTLSAPMTLVLKTLPVQASRRLSRILKGRLLRAAGDPVSASLLNVGGLWILYTTDLYMAMHMHPLVNLLVHIHLFLAGCLFTRSMIYIDPTPHRTGFVYRAVILILAFAGHSILSKYVYIHPPAGVSFEQARIGGMIMYYGGDAIEIALLTVFCLQWFQAVRPRACVEV